MKIVTSLDDYRTEYLPSVIALGTFDGLHLGHRNVIETAGAYAKEHCLQLAVFTFSNHPLVLINADHVPPKVITADDKVRLLEEMGVDLLINIPFDRELSELSPDAFLQKLKIFNYRCLVVGENYSYGFMGSGKTDTLKISGQRNGFDVIVCPLVKLHDKIVSSTSIRNLIAAGKLGFANEMLGRSYSLEGIVTHGNKRGRTIGFPTANLEISGTEFVVPQSGVYAVEIYIDGKVYQGMANVGNNPTFGDVKDRRLEVNVFGFTGNLYDKKIKIFLKKYMRDEIKFDSIEALCRQIERDQALIKAYFA